MFKMHYFSKKYSISPSAWEFPPSAPSLPLTFDVGDLKLRDLTKLWFLTDYHAMLPNKTS